MIVHELPLDLLLIVLSLVALMLLKELLLPARPSTSHR